MCPIYSRMPIRRLSSHPNIVIIAYYILLSSIFLVPPTGIDPVLRVPQTRVQPLTLRRRIYIKPNAFEIRR